jgi:quinol monooxygenase YgiN
MHILHVDLLIKPEARNAFLEVTSANARESMKEPGCVSFDILQDKEAPAHFRLVEVYCDEAAVGEHKKTAHYQTWAATMDDCLAGPRSKNVFSNTFPKDAAWQ